MNVPNHYITEAAAVDHGILRLVLAEGLGGEVETKSGSGPQRLANASRRRD